MFLFFSDGYVDASMAGGERLIAILINRYEDKVFPLMLIFCSYADGRRRVPRCREVGEEKKKKKWTVFMYLIFFGAGC